ASDGRREPGHIARYHCLNATSPRGFLTGADCPRSLDHEYACFNPKGLKHRYYFYDWDRGHRAILNLRAAETYTRHYHSLGAAKAFYVPNRGKDPESVNVRYRIRGNGERTWRPRLAPETLDRVVHARAGVTCRPEGIEPASPSQPGHAIFKIEGTNVLTSLTVDLGIERDGEGKAALAVSTTNGLRWTDVQRGDQAGAVTIVEPVNGAYEALVRVTLEGKTRLTDIAFKAITMLNSKTQPKLLLGRNTVHVGAGEQTGSIVVWPELQADGYKRFAVDEHNVASAQRHPGYRAALYAAKPKEDAWVTFRIDAPRDITRLVVGGRLYNRAPKAHIDFLHSFDGGKSWRTSWSLTETKPPWDVIHYETIDTAPPGTRSVHVKYLWNASEAGPNACGLYAVRIEANHKPAHPSLHPLEVAFAWAERQADYSLVERSHVQLVEKLPFRYALNVGGVDHPVVRSLRVGPRTAEPGAQHGYADKRDAGGEKFVHRWVTYGRILSERKPYTCTVPSLANWGAGDPDGKKLTDGVVGPPYAGGTAPRSGAAWKAGQKPDVTVDLGKAELCGAFRIHLTAGWPWWDALKGEVKDQVEALTSLDGKEFTSRGTFDFALRWKAIPINHLMPDEETARGYTFPLVLAAPVSARYVRFRIAPARILVVSEVQVLDGMGATPFDLRIALPEE
ncbi:hypothetical protein HQ560_05555, partial [bacterium]|nr:hypothetical protein [bacterium]